MHERGGGHSELCWMRRDVLQIMSLGMDDQVKWLSFVQGAFWVGPNIEEGDESIERIRV